MLEVVKAVTGLQNTSKTEVYLLWTRYLIISFIFIAIYDEKLAYEIMFGWSSVGIVFFYLSLSIAYWSREIAVFLAEKKAWLFAKRVEVAKDTIDNVCTVDFIEWILKNNGLPIMPTKERFGVTNEWIKKIWDNLERVGIMTRGASNARCMATDDVDMICKALAGVSDSNALQQVFERVSETEYKARNPSE